MALHQTYLSCNGELYPHYFLCHYLPKSAGRDTFSHSLLKFKAGRQPDLDGWIDCALEALAAATSPKNTTFTHDTTLVRALHHDETSIPDSPTSLDLLAQQLAEYLHIQYHPRLLKKRRPARAVKTFGKPRRKEELEGLYIIDHAHAATLPAAPHHFLILDDLLTSGSTMHIIIQTLKTHYPDARFTLFTLTRAQNTPAPHDPTAIHGSKYCLEEGAEWTLL